MSDEPLSYIARRACGCICAAAVDNPDRREYTAKMVARWIRDGLQVESVAVDVARSGPWGCGACKRPAVPAEVVLLGTP